MAAAQFELRSWLASFRPKSPRYRGADYLRGALGAFVGIVAAAYAAKAFDIGAAAVPFIVAPMGASAVLLFAAPASPLAQPWQVVAGNLVSTVIGVVAGRIFDDTVLAASSAVAVAIAVMMLLRCVHPPGGACALFAAVGAPAVHHQGFAFAVFPVAVNTLFLLAVAIAVNNLTGRRYPHAAPVVVLPAAGKDLPPTQRLGVQSSDVERAMARLDQGLDILAGDVVALVRDAEVHAVDRQLGRLTCESIMMREVTTILSTETVYRARLIITQLQVKAVIVVDDERHVIGIITVLDLFNLGLANLEPVSKVMSTPVTTIRAAAPVADLVALMSDLGLRHVPVVDHERHLVGIVTRAELVAVLNQALVGASGLPMP